MAKLIPLAIFPCFSVDRFIGTGCQVNLLNNSHFIRSVSYQESTVLSSFPTFAERLDAAGATGAGVLCAVCHGASVDGAPALDCYGYSRVLSPFIRFFPGCVIPHLIQCF